MAILSRPDLELISRIPFNKEHRVFLFSKSLYVFYFTFKLNIIIYACTWVIDIIGFTPFVSKRYSNFDFGALIVKETSN